MIKNMSIRTRDARLAKVIISVVLVIIFATGVYADAVITGNFSIVNYSAPVLNTVSVGEQRLHVMDLSLNNPNAAGTVGYRVTGINISSADDFASYAECVFIEKDGIVLGQYVISSSAFSVLVPINDIIPPLQTAHYKIYIKVKEDALSEDNSISIDSAFDIVIQRELDAGYTVQAESGNNEFPFNSDTFRIVPPSWTESFYNFPNPFNSDKEETVIQYYLNGTADLSFKIFDMSGRLVKTFVDNKREESDTLYKFRWDGTNDNGVKVISGVYYAVITIGDVKYNTKIVIIK